MTHPTVHMPMVRGAIAAVALSLGLAGNGMAEGYDFNRLVPGGGGGGGTDPAKKKVVAERGQYICLDVKPGPGGQVVFTLWSTIPEPKARLHTISFDTGSKRPDLVSSMKVTFQPPGPKAQITTSRGSGTLFKVFLPYEHSGGNKFTRGGLSPGNVILISATLGPGQTFANLMDALNEGLNPAREAYGLSVSVAGHNFLGGPPPGMMTINDDATFTLRGRAAHCQR